MLKRVLIIFVAILLQSVSFATTPPENEGRIICYDWDNINPKEAENIQSNSQLLLSLLIDVNIEQLWLKCDSIFRQDISRQKFVDFTYSLAERFVTLDKLSFIDGKLIVISRRLAHPVLISCPSDNSYRIKIWPGLQKMAAVFFEKKDGYISHRIVLVLGQRADGVFRLISLFINPFTFVGKDASYYQNLAAKSGKGGDMISRFWFLQLASMLSQTGPVVQFNESLALMKTVQEMYTDPEFLSKMRQITARGKRYSLFNLSFIELGDELIPLVSYLSYYNGTDRSPETADKIDAEARMLYKVLRASHPALFEEFPSVMFQAYFEPPVDPKKRYPFFKVRVDPTRVGN